MTKPRPVIKGTAADPDGSVGSVAGTVNNKSATVTGAISWSLSAPLKRGKNLVRVQATDNLGLASGFTTVTVTRR